jgi:hypothetical protein
MTTDPYIPAKITFSGNNAQFKNHGAQFAQWGFNSIVQQNGIAYLQNLYIALTNPCTMHLPLPNKQYKA